MSLQLKRRLAESLRTSSPGLFRFLKSSVHLATGRALREDFLDRWTGRRDELTPPRRLLFDGTQDYAEFQRLGVEFLGFLKAEGLQPTDRVLEIGSGNGKNARALATYLTTGSYDGFDIVEPGVAWCRQHITERYPNIRFAHADVYNRSYNPGGKISASAYRFPYPDGAFDLVFLTSVFTHMLPEDLDHYLAEIARVLRPGGQCLASFFLLTSKAITALTAGTSGRAFPFEFGAAGCRVSDRDWPEDAVAYEEHAMRRFYVRHGLRIAEPIRHGEWWRGNANAQDLVIAVKAVGP